MITTQMLDNYRLELAQASQDANDFLKAVIAAYIDVNPNAQVAEIREYTITALQDGLYLYGDQAKYLANSFFDALAVQYGSNATAKIYDTIDNEEIKKKVHYYAKSINEGDTDKFINDVANLTSYYVKREAFQNMIRNCAENNIRYARVPSGRETCAFCFMLSSRGFVYWTKKTAGAASYSHAYHNNCDCVVVPGFHEDTGIYDDEQIESYKPSELRARYKQCEHAINPNGTWKETFERWEKLETENKTSVTWEQFKLKELLKEIETHDWHWLWTGKKANANNQVD